MQKDKSKEVTAFTNGQLSKIKQLIYLLLFLEVGLLFTHTFFRMYKNPD